jgi:IPT/TIG domain
MPTERAVVMSHKQSGPAFLLVLLLFLLLSARQTNAQIAPPGSCTNGTKPNNIFLEGITPPVIQEGSPNTQFVIQFRLNGGSLDIDPDANSPNLNAFAVIWSGAFAVSGLPDSVTAVDINASRYALRFTADSVLLTPAQEVTLSFVATFCNGGAQTSDTTTLLVANLTPNIATINPQSAPAGSAGFNLTVNGTGFINTSRVRWNGSDRPTTFVSSNQLTAAISTSDLAGGGLVSVTVFNPAPGGGESNAITFQVVNPAPTISSVSPLSVTAGGPDFPLTVNGTAFNNTSRVRWNGSDRPTTFASSTQLTATISASDIATAASVSVTVFNPAPGGGTSTAVGFSVEAAEPITGLGVFRNGLWFVDWNGNREWDEEDAAHVFAFGLPGDYPIMGDWNGDGRLKPGIYRNGLWFVDWNGNHTFDAEDAARVIPFGLPGDVPIVGDWNGDGRLKDGVFRNGLWVVDYNGCNCFDPQGFRVYVFGLPGDLPIMGDWNGDGRLKLGVFRNGLWFVDWNGNGTFDAEDAAHIFVFGLPGDLPIVDDWNGDGRLKLGVFRNGLWFVDWNGNGTFDAEDAAHIFAFGLPGDSPVIGNWDPSRQITTLSSSVGSTSAGPISKDTSGPVDIWQLQAAMKEVKRQEQHARQIGARPELQWALLEAQSSWKELENSSHLQTKLRRMQDEMVRTQELFREKQTRAGTQGQN